MRFKVILTQPTDLVPVNNQHYMNGFNHSIIGENNKYHDKFSAYAISSLQGGKLCEDKKHLFFESDPYFFVSSNNMEFIGYFINNITFNSASVFGMKVKRIDVMCDFMPNTSFDNIITISPIILYNEDYTKKCTIKNDSNYIERLNKHCLSKLKHLGIVDDTFKIEVVKPECSKEKSIWVGDVFNPSTLSRFKVYGKKETRYALYTLGIGCSTGSGFGSVEIFK